jgi:exopolysaccharide production protein ExoQ
MLKRAGSAVEVAFYLFGISIYMGAYTMVPMAFSGAQLKMGETNPVFAVSMSILLFGTIILAAVRWQGVFFVMRHGGALNLVVILAFMSASWSYFPAVSLKRSVVLAQTILFAYCFVASFPMRRIIQIWASALFLAMLSSLAIVLAFPEAGIMSAPAGTWRGVFSHKSSLGGAAAFSALCGGWLWLHGSGHRLRHGIGLLLCLFLAIMSESKTAQITIVLIIGIAMSLRLLRLPGIGRIWAIFLILTGSVCGGSILALFFTDLMIAFGKDPSLTGRVPVWTMLLNLASDRILYGYGYGAFFIDGNPDSDYVTAASGWEINEAHNSYVEALLQLGIPGLILMLWTMSEAAWRAIRLWREGGEPWLSFAAAYTLSLFVTNLVETSLFLRAGDMHGAMMSLILVALRIESARRKASVGARAFPPRRPVDPLYIVGPWQPQRAAELHPVPLQTRKGRALLGAARTASGGPNSGIQHPS